MMEGGPWAYDNHFTVYERVQQGDELEKTSLTNLAPWDQVWQLSVGYMSENVAQRIRDELGKYLESDPNNFTSVQRDYMRL